MEEALAMQRASLGAGHPDITTSLHKIGVVLQAVSRERQVEERSLPLAQ